MYEEFKNRLKDGMSERRYLHSLGVADEAKRLALLYGADEGKAYLAGLLHDCAKEIKNQAEKCDELGIRIDDMMRQNTGLIHGPLGAAVAKRDFGVSDEEILSAIRWHTLGRAGMTLLEKIVYIADYTEKNRVYEGVEELRKAVDADLDDAILLSIERHLKVLEKRGAAVHPNTILLRDDIILNRAKGRNKSEQ